MATKTIEEIGPLDGYAHCKTCIFERRKDEPYIQSLEVGVKTDTETGRQYVYVNCKAHGLNITRWEVHSVYVSCDCCDEEEE